MNGGWGFGQYRPDSGGGLLRPFAPVAAEIDGGLISGLVTLLGSEERFGQCGPPSAVAPGRERAAR